MTPNKINRRNYKIKTFFPKTVFIDVDVRPGLRPGPKNLELTPSATLTPSILGLIYAHVALNPATSLSLPNMAATSRVGSS